MTVFFFDASALAKRYSLETGSDRVDYLFGIAARDRLMCLMLGAAEVFSVLVRKRNSGVLSTSAFLQGFGNLTSEVVQPNEFSTLEVDNEMITAAMRFIDLHALNATDAVVLRCALDLSAQLRAEGNDLVLVASDHRLLRAAQAEGLLTFDPETQTEADLDALIAS